MKTLVTGGAGFIGSAVTRLLLERGHAVTVLDDLSSGYRANVPSEAEFEIGDVRDGPIVSRAAADKDAIFHLAASVGNRRAIERPLDDATVNIIGSLNVLLAARDRGVGIVVYSSSAAIFGEPQELPITVDHPVHPASPYGVSKLAAEKYCFAFAALWGIRCVALRYFNVYGERQRFDEYGNVIPIFATRALHKKELTIFGNGEQTRDFVHVDDVARANLSAAERTDAHGALNIGSGRATSIRRVAEMIVALSGASSAIAFGPPRPGDVTHATADVSAATRLIGYRPAVALEDGLRRYLQWLQVDESSKP
jgi:UDP-glucose 4-epimerase